MPDNTVIVAAAAALVVGIAIGYLSRRFLAANSVKHAEGYAERLMAEARAKQKEIVLEGKDDALKVQRAAEEEAREKRTDLQRQERLLLDRAEFSPHTWLYVSEPHYRIARIHEPRRRSPQEQRRQGAGRGKVLGLWPSAKAIRR